MAAGPPRRHFLSGTNLSVKTYCSVVAALTASPFGSLREAVQKPARLPGFPVHFRDRIGEALLATRFAHSSEPCWMTGSGHEERFPRPHASAGSEKAE